MVLRKKETKNEKSNLKFCYDVIVNVIYKKWQYSK